MTVPMILASGSPTRARLLSNAGLEFAVETPRVDESALRDALLAEHTPPRDIADALAEMKAQRVSTKQPAALVLGADQVLDCDGVLLAKPGSRDEAAEQLRFLRGKAHKLHTALVASEAGRPVWRNVATATLHVREFSDGFLASYLDRNWPDVAQCVGAYKLEAEGVRLFSRIDGDYFTILGLQVPALLSYLMARGIVQP